MATTRLLQGGMEPVSQRPRASAYTTPADGDFVVLDSDGLVAIATATSASLLGRAKPSYESGQVLVVEAKPNVQFLMRCTGTPTQTNVGETFDLAIASGEFKVNLSASDYDVVRIEEILDAAKGLVFVSVPAAKSQAL